MMGADRVCLESIVSAFRVYGSRGLAFRVSGFGAVDTRILNPATRSRPGLSRITWASGASGCLAPCMRDNPEGASTQ